MTKWLTEQRRKTQVFQQQPRIGYPGSPRSTARYDTESGATWQIERSRNWKHGPCLAKAARFAAIRSLVAQAFRYEVLTKSANAALLATLQSRITPDTAWVRVGKNADMVAWADYQLRTCPYPLTVGFERFHTPQGFQYAVLLASSADYARDVRAWFRDYNARQTVEAGIKQSKTVFHVQHPMSRSLVGMQIQLAFTVFAANFVQWAQAWVQEHLVAAQDRMARAFTRLKTLVRIAANSPATVETYPGQTLVRFSPTSSLAGVVLRLTAAAVQLALPLFGGGVVDSS